MHICTQPNTESAAYPIHACEVGLTSCECDEKCGPVFRIRCIRPRCSSGALFQLLPVDLEGFVLSLKHLSFLDIHGCSRCRNHRESTTKHDTQEETDEDLCVVFCCALVMVSMSKHQLSQQSTFLMLQTRSKNVLHVVVLALTNIRSSNIKT